MSTQSSPTTSQRSSRRSSRSPGLSLDLTNLPPLSMPTPPSNTLIITNLDTKEIFSAPNLLTIKDLINATAPIHTWAPLKSFSRIIVSFYDIDAAIRIKQVLDHERIMGSLAKVYFGSHTNVEPKDEHLNLPDAGKLFFISPPPSPPQGWEMKLEDAPNKLVHAEDLAEALAKLHNRPAPGEALEGKSPASESMSRNGRTRSSSTTIYDPNEHGNSPGLPAISVTTEGFGDEAEWSPLTMERPIIAHTSRPPVELMS